MSLIKRYITYLTSWSLIEVLRLCLGLWIAGIFLLLDGNLTRTWVCLLAFYLPACVFYGSLIWDSVAVLWHPEHFVPRTFLGRRIPMRPIAVGMLCFALCSCALLLKEVLR